MKKTLLAFGLATLCLVACEKNTNEVKSDNNNTANNTAKEQEVAQKTSSNADAPKAIIKFETENYNFGNVNEGEKVKYAYKFKNEGKTPLIIESAKPSCGCTVPTFPKDPIPPGGTGEIVAEFDSQGRPGETHKTITITANTEPTTTVLNLKGFVKGKNPVNEDLNKLKGPLRNQ
ncbi:MAG: DUF1573 domain-containing protein [Raineya sp.]